jgi:hypothetical protein
VGGLDGSEVGGELVLPAKSRHHGAEPRHDAGSLLVRSVVLLLDEALGDPPVYRDHVLRIPIGQVWPLEDVNRALGALAGRAVTGKVNPAGCAEQSRPETAGLVAFYRGQVVFFVNGELQERPAEEEGPYL